MNVILLKEKMKNDILNVIGKYESDYKTPVLITSAVLSEIMCEMKSVEMLEMLKGEPKNGETGEKSI